MGLAIAHYVLGAKGHGSIWMSLATLRPLATRKERKNGTAVRFIFRKASAVAATRGKRLSYV